MRSVPVGGELRSSGWRAAQEGVPSTIGSSAIRARAAAATIGSVEVKLVGWPVVGCSASASRTAHAAS